MKILSYQEVLDLYSYGEISELIAEAMIMGRFLDENMNFYSHFIKRELEATKYLKHFFNADEMKYDQEWETVQIVGEKLINVYEILNAIKGNDRFEETLIEFLEDLLRNLPDGMSSLVDTAVKIKPTELNRTGMDIINGLNAFEEINDLFISDIVSVICGDKAISKDKRYTGLVQQSSLFWTSAIVHCLELKNKKYHKFILQNKQSKDLFKKENLQVCIVPSKEGWLKIMVGESYARHEISAFNECYFRASLAGCLEESISQLEEIVKFFFSLLEDECNEILIKIHTHRDLYIYEDTYLEKYEKEIKFLCEEDKIFAIIDPHGNELHLRDTDLI